jgi:serine/threonine-protein kinase ATR
LPCGPEVAAAGRLREVSAILKLVGFTALKFPGVFYNGRAADVLSVIARIITFLAEPNFRHCLPSPPFSPR